MMTRQELDAKYDNARLVYREVSAAHRAIQKTFRAGHCTDDQFLASRRSLELAASMFDEAETSYINRCNELEAA